MIIYLVTSGSYSDYGIEGAFSSRELAQECIEGLERWDEAKIEAWPVDDLTASLRDPRPIWAVSMERDGTTRSVERAKMDLYRLRNLREPPQVMQERAAGKLIKTYLYGIFRAEDEQGAVKMLNEYRTRWLAEGRLE